MKDRIFIDTNILIYLYSEDEQEKKKASIGIFGKYHCVTSMQVINELSNVLYKKFKVHSSKILAVIDEIVSCCEIAQIGIDTVKDALAIAEKYKYSYYDSLIISSALQNNCVLLISEDMQDKQMIHDSLKIWNIFSNIEPTTL